MLPTRSERPPGRRRGRRADRYDRMMDKDPISGVWLIEELAEDQIRQARDENQMWMKAQLCRGRT